MFVLMIAFISGSLLRGIVATVMVVWAMHLIVVIVGCLPLMAVPLIMEVICTSAMGTSIPRVVTVARMVSPFGVSQKLQCKKNIISLPIVFSFCNQGCNEQQIYAPMSQIAIKISNRENDEF